MTAVKIRRLSTKPAIKLSPSNRPIRLRVLPRALPADAEFRVNGTDLEYKLATDSGWTVLADLTQIISDAGAVLETDFDANTILAANTDDTPAALTVAEQTLVGRITGGNIDALTASEVRTLLNVEDGATADPDAATSTELASTANGEGASLIGVEDSAGNFTGTDVEAVLTELAAGQSEPVGANGITFHEALVVKYVSATEADIDADAVQVKNASGLAVRLETVDLTVDITASGANGLDTGSEANSAWYYLWVIWNGSTTAGLASTSATLGGLTLPSGYTHAGLVGTVYNDSSGDFVRFLQRGRKVSARRGDNVALTNGTDASFTAIDLSTLVPPIAISVDCEVSLKSSSGTNTVFAYLSSSGSGTTADYDQRLAQASVASGAPIIMTLAQVPVFVAQQIEYYAGGTNVQIDINLAGWEY